MQFNVEGKRFQQQLQAVSKVINSKNTISMLDNFLLEVEGDRLSITGSDQENMLTAYMEISESEGDGAICINARRLLDIAKEIDNQPLSFFINDTTKEVDLTFLNGHFNFMGVNADDYPRSREIAPEHEEMFLPSSVVLKGILNTLFAVSGEDSRPAMTGIYWDIHPEDITFVSSDTHKLVRYVNSERQPGLEGHFILPAKTAGILKSLISKSDVDVKIEFDERGGVFEFGDYLLSSLFVNGRYPDYNRVIPTNNPFQLTVDRVSLINALRRVSLSSSRSSNLVSLNIDADEIVVKANDLDYQTDAEEHVVCSYEGNPMLIGFNGLFMVDILSNIDSESVIIELSDPARPGVFKPLEQKERENALTIQMPMQVL